MRAPFSRAVLTLTTAAVASTVLMTLTPAQAAFRPGSSTTDKSGDTTTLTGSPSARQKKMSDVRRFRFEWERSSVDQTTVMVSYRVPDQKGAGPNIYEARDDIALDYRTADGTEHQALIAVDPSDASAGPWGLSVMEGPHVADAEAEGADCSPGWSAITESGSYTEVSADFPAVCLGDLETVTGSRLIHTSRFDGARVSDTARLSAAATLPATPAWRRHAVSAPRGDATYSPWHDERFADLLSLRQTYSPDSGRVTVAVKLAAISGSQGPRQQLRLNLDGDQKFSSAVAYVPGSGGKAGSFSVPKCSGEDMSLKRRTHTLTLSFPADCVGPASLWVDVWSAALRRGGTNSGSDWVGDQAGITLF